MYLLGLISHHNSIRVRAQWAGPEQFHFVWGQIPVRGSVHFLNGSRIETPALALTHVFHYMSLRHVEARVHAVKVKFLIVWTFTRKLQNPSPGNQMLHIICVVVLSMCSSSCEE